MPLNRVALFFPVVLLAGCADLIGANFDRPGIALRDGGNDANVPESGAPDAQESVPCPPEADTCRSRCGSVVDACGQVRACGGCPEGQVCGGAGANTCGTGTCQPNCAGKKCGESNGCDGICGEDAGRCAACGGKGELCCDGGTCADGLGCGAGSRVGTCDCAPKCAGTCGGDDGCGGTCPPVRCPTGTRCASGACVCDPATCTGCCMNGRCEPGTSVSACGIGGATCVACPSGAGCVEGKCTTSCSMLRDTCNIDGDCCGEARCGGSTGRCCNPSGHYCDTEDDCCYHLPCRGGSCL